MASDQETRKIVEENVRLYVSNKHNMLHTNERLCMMSSYGRQSFASRETAGETETELDVSEILCLLSLVCRDVDDYEKEWSVVKRTNRPCPMYEDFPSFVGRVTLAPAYSIA